MPISPSQIIELPFQEIHDKLQDPHNLEKFLDRIITTIGKVEEIGEKILVLSNPENNFEKLFIFYLNKEKLPNNLIGKTVRVFFELKIDNNDVIMILHAIRILDSFISKIYMNLLKKEDNIFGDKKWQNG